jgi:hypothetical protein
MSRKQPSIFVTDTNYCQIQETAPIQARERGPIVSIESREDANALRGLGLTDYLCTFASSREILSTGDTKNWVPAFAGMTDGLSRFHE